MAKQLSLEAAEKKNIQHGKKKSDSSLRGWRETLGKSTPAPQEDKHTPLDALALGSFLHWKLEILGLLERLLCLLRGFLFAFLGEKENPYYWS